MIESLLSKLPALLRANAEILDAVHGSAADRKAVRDELRAALVSDPEAFELFTSVCCYQAPYGESWVHGPGEDGPYLSLDIAADALDEHRYRRLMVAVVTTDSPAVPYDYRALAAAALVRVGLGDHLPELQALADSPDLPVRGLGAKLVSRTDGIDHLFDIPETVADRLALLRAASAAKTNETRRRLVRRVLDAIGHRAPTAEQVVADAYLSPEAEHLIAEDLAGGLGVPRDYLMVWDEIPVPDAGGNGLTVAELLRIVLLCGEFKLPDATVRPVLIDFYRSVLRISGRAIVGLAAGVFHVEHGVEANPSLFYLGRDAVLGKGCVIDCVGGAVIQSGSFLGGGFIPILIHTHKHIRSAGEPGSAERKQVLPCVFAAKAGARLPMEAIGIFESADYLDGKPISHAGIHVIALR
ncbi:hypothetical protein ACFY3U_27565 [Micromonospora sp. NPDC000089]|uniref:hypothetical protein n=1 Tax=unclassified Micromonospora TaxID=2617518 RepID=UPI00369C146A